MKAALVALAGLTLAGPVLTGCYRETIQLDDPDGAPLPWDAGPPVDSGFVPPAGKCVEPAGVDLLFVIDNSGSMAEEQASLAAELPSFVRALIEPPDTDADGRPDWLPIPDLHVGVVTTDMGTGGFDAPTCDARFGDDGVLRTRGSTEGGCMATYPSFFAYRTDAGSPDALAFDVGCVTRAGTSGCGFEQPLEALLKALSPAAPTSWTSPDYTPPSFFGDTAGHGDGANRGFVRENTLLAGVIVTDEEDCSAADPRIFDEDSPRYPGLLNLRCWEHPEALHPVERYVEGLAALRANRPDLLAVGIVAGVPVDLAVSSPNDSDYARMLADPRMEERVDPSMPSQLSPSCEVPGRGVAFPPRRLVNLARRLGPTRATVQSICQEDFTPVAAAFARLVGQRACTRFEEE